MLYLRNSWIQTALARHELVQGPGPKTALEIFSLVIFIFTVIAVIQTAGILLSLLVIFAIVRREIVVPVVIVVKIGIIVSVV